jgi:hypothetical protein
MRLKQLLKESQTVKPKFIVIVETTSNLEFGEYNSVKANALELPNCKWCTLDNEFVQFEFEDLPADKCQTRHLERLYDECCDIVNEVGEVDRADSYLSCAGYLPPFPISYEVIHIALSKDTVLTGIEKLIRCSDLYILRCEVLEPTGVLSLLKIKDCVIYLENGFKNGGPLCKWADIVQGHLDGDKDVMDCHEELTRAGLKAYAKF